MAERDDNGVIFERLFLDKADQNILHDEMTAIDSSLTRPWTVMKNYRRSPKVWWGENNCIDGQTWVVGRHLVTVSPDAFVTGTPSVGDRVRVSGRRTESGELVIDKVQVLADARPASTPAQVPAQDSGAGATSAQPATDTTPPDTVNPPAPQARPPAPESGRVADPGNHADKGDKGDKGHKGS